MICKCWTQHRWKQAHCRDVLSGTEQAIHAQVQPAYAMLDAFHHGHVESRPSVTAIIAEAEHLRESQDLFELYVVDYIMLTRCKVGIMPLLPKSFLLGFFSPGTSCSPFLSSYSVRQGWSWSEQCCAVTTLLIQVSIQC